MICRLNSIDLSVSTCALATVTLQFIGLSFAGTPNLFISPCSYQVEAASASITQVRTRLMKLVAKKTRRESPPPSQYSEQLYFLLFCYTVVSRVPYCFSPRPLPNAVSAF